MFVILKPFYERHGTPLASEGIAARLRARLQREVPEARVLVFGRRPCGASAMPAASN